MSEVLRRFLPKFIRTNPTVDEAQRRAIWAIRHCRKAMMGGHIYACAKCGKREFAYHSCNHRSCPLCGRAATAQWVKRELAKQVGAPYFMVTFTLPSEARRLFFGPQAKAVYDTFFTASATALRETLANPRWLGAENTGFTAILHTWNQRLHFHPHLHYIVPGAGINAQGRVVKVKHSGFLVPVRILSKSFRAHFKRLITSLELDEVELPEIDPALWEKNWGVHIQEFGGGSQAIKYLGRYVCRTAIGDSRIVGIDGDKVRFRWKDRAHNNMKRVEEIDGVEFARRYLRHVLPRGMRAIRHFGFCHPAAKAKREKVAIHTGCPLIIGPVGEATQANPENVRECPNCSEQMNIVADLLPLYYFHWIFTLYALKPRPP